MHSFFSASSWTKIAKIVQLSYKLQTEAMANSLWEQVYRKYSNIWQLMKQLYFNVSGDKTKQQQKKIREDDLLNTLRCLK